MACTSIVEPCTAETQQPAPEAPAEIVLPDFEGDQHEGFWMPTRCWVEKYGVLLTLNERRYYDLQALYYNKNQKRSFPGREQIEAYFSRDPAQECRARKGLAMLGLIEWWREPSGRRYSRRFFRMPYVAANLRHYGTRKQPSADELLALKASGELPEGYEWLEKYGVELLTPRVTPEQVDDEVGRRIARWYSGRQP